MTISKDKFRNASGVKLTKALFYETTGEDKSSVVYTLKGEDHKGFLSLKKKYIETEDITEYEFANRYLFDFDHWMDLCECTWFKPHVALWREELRRKLESRYIWKLMEMSESGGKEGLQATKILLERNKKPVQKIKRPDPSQGSGHPWKTSRNASNSEIAIPEDFIVKDAYRRLMKANVS